MKILLLILLTIITSCKVLQDKYLYDEDSDGYGKLEEAAAKECIENNSIFTNLKATSFEDYDILGSSTPDNYIKIKNRVFIRINEISSDSVTFTVINANEDFDNDSETPFLANAKYTISKDDNNAIVDMIAAGVCANKDYEGTPAASSSSLSFKTKSYNVQDGSDLSSSDAPSHYEERRDSFVMNTSYPAFLFLWYGAFQTWDKNEGDTAVTTTDLVLELSITDSNLAECESELSNTEDGDSDDSDDCTNAVVSSGALVIDADAYDSTRAADSDNKIRSFYFNNFQASK